MPRCRPPSHFNRDTPAYRNHTTALAITSRSFYRVTPGRTPRRRGCGRAAAACEARGEARGEQGGESDRVLLHRDLTERLSRVCAGGHPACTRIVRGGPTSNGCYGEEAGAVLARLGRGDLHCVHSALPRAAAGEYPMLVGDFTPNYLCDPEALPRLKASAADPSALRFIVAMREPAARAFSEWAMFALQWTWEPIADFGPAFASKAAQLRDCNESLWRETELLRSLPTEERDHPRSAEIIGDHARLSLLAARRGAGRVPLPPLAPLEPFSERR